VAEQHKPEQSWRGRTGSLWPLVDHDPPEHQGRILPWPAPDVESRSCCPLALSGRLELGPKDQSEPFADGNQPASRRVSPRQHRAKRGAPRFSQRAIASDRGKFQRRTGHRCLSDRQPCWPTSGQPAAILRRVHLPKYWPINHLRLSRSLPGLGKDRTDLTIDPAAFSRVFLWTRAYQPMTIFDSMTLRARSRSDPVSCM
jgi:hypothetical protein